MNGSAILLLALFAIGIIGGTIRELKKTNEENAQEKIALQNGIKKSNANVDRILNYLEKNKCFANFEIDQFVDKDDKPYQKLNLINDEGQSKIIGLASGLSNNNDYFLISNKNIKFDCLYGKENIETTVLKDNFSTKLLSQKEKDELMRVSKNKPTRIEVRGEI
jgi:hypothetical protein